DGATLAQWVAIGPQGLVARGVYRNKETDVELDLEALADYIGKRARKGRALALQVRQPKLLRRSAENADMNLLSGLLAIWVSRSPRCPVGMNSLWKIGTQCWMRQGRPAAC